MSQTNANPASYQAAGKGSSMRLFLGPSVLLALLLPVAAQQIGSQPRDTSGAEHPNMLVFKSDAKYTGPNLKILPLFLPDGRLVVTLGNVIYMVAPDGRTIWSYPAVGVVTAQPVFRPDRNGLAIVDSALEFVVLDGATGKVRFRDFKTGHSQYTDLQQFEDGYLSVEDMSDYRVRFRGGPGAEMKDELEYWSEGDFLNPTAGGHIAHSGGGWSVDFPIGARLAVAGSHIYAVTYGPKDVTIQEIQPGSTEPAKTCNLSAKSAETLVMNVPAVIDLKSRLKDACVKPGLAFDKLAFFEVWDDCTKSPSHFMGMYSVDLSKGTVNFDGQAQPVDSAQLQRIRTKLMEQDCPTGR